MNQDDFISKYLDGELSPQEDEQLRFMLSEDDHAKEEFDDAVFLHMAIKEDAESIEPPRDLINDTEHKILMKILSQKPVSVDRVYRRPQVRAMASLVAMFLLISIFKTSDLDFIKTDGFFAESLSKVKYNLTSEVVPDNEDFYKGSLRTTPKSKIVNPGQTTYSDSRPDNQLAYMKTEEVISTPVETTPIPEFVDESQLGAGTSLAEVSDANIENDFSKSHDLDVDTEVSSILATNKHNEDAEAKYEDRHNIIDELLISDTKNYENINARTTIPNPSLESEIAPIIPLANNITSTFPINMNHKDFYDNNSEVQVASFFGTDVQKSGIESDKETLVSHFSQSLAYSLNDDHRLGVEGGISSYSYEETENRYFSLSKANKRGGIESLDDNVEFSPTTVNIPITTQQNLQVFWGAAFYELEMINTNDLTLNGRIGIGATSDGPLGYSRLFTQYEIMYGIALTLGAEGRVFKSKMSGYPSGADNLKSNISIVYGFKFKI